jgi:hypothetical protein
MTPKLISAKELAVRYSLHPKTVWKYARCGLLPSVRMAARCVRFDVEKCDLALDRRSRGFITIAQSTVILWPFLVAILATVWLPFSPEREATAFLNRGYGFDFHWGHHLFARAKRLGTRILNSLSQACAWESAGGAICV